METCKMSDMKNLVGSVLVLTISLILAGCSSQDDVTLESGKPPTETDADVVKIVTSFSMIEDMAADIGGEQDRKSTRLNSSHVAISYAVFCLKKNKRASHAA